MSTTANHGTVSVAMAAYNGAAHIAEQIASILSELGPDDELIVVDDVSRDATAEIVEGFDDPRIRLIRNERNGGYVRAFEKGLLAADGEFLFISDQDDVWLPGRVAAMRAALADVDIVATNLSVLGSDSGLPGPYGQEDWRLRAADSRRHLRNVVGVYAGNRPYYGSAMAMRRSARDVVLPFPRYLPEQYDLWIALYGNLARSMAHLERRTVAHRFHDANDTPNRPRWGFMVIYTRLRLLALTAHVAVRLARRAVRSRR